jgi:hypothetical protein
MNASTIGQDACADGTSYCPQCGTAMEALACYCSQCGTKAPKEHAAQAQKRLSVELVTLLPAQMLGSRLHSKYYGRLICADNALYFIQGYEVSPWLRSWVGLPFILWKERRAKKALAGITHLSPAKQVQMMHGSFRLAISEIASYDIFLNANEF